MAKQTALVIGSGIGGLSAACLLASQGYKVQVFEQANTYGGKIGKITNGDFQFDAGPSLFTLPDVADSIFEYCGKNPRDYYHFKQLPLICKYFFEDKTEINAYANLTDFKKELVDKCQESPEQLNAYFKQIEADYNFTAPVFLQNPIRQFYKHLPYSFGKSLQSTLKMSVFKTLNQDNEHWFTNAKTKQIFNRFATYNGSNPYKAPATLHVIPHLEHNLGAYYVEGGMRKLADAFYQLAIDMGVAFHFNHNVDDIVVKNKKAVGIRAKNEMIQADVVFCNMDMNHAYTKLLPNQNAPKLLLKQEKSTSALVFYWSMNKEFEKLDVHNLLFSANYKAEFDALANGTVFNDPSIYIYISSKINKNHAAVQGENWFTMINVPHNQGQDWEKIIKDAKQNIVNKVNRMLATDITPHIKQEQILDPLEIEQKTSSYAGALYGNSSNNLFAAFLRHPHQNKNIKNLFFVGGSVHPGGGIPLCIYSAKIACSALEKQN